MAIAQAQTPQSKNTASSNNDTLAYGSAVTAGNLLVMAVRTGNGDETLSVSDSVNGAWTVARQQFLSAHGKVQIAYFTNTAAGTPTVTVSFTTATSVRWSIHEYGGFTATPALDQANSATGASGQPSGYGVTTTVADELIFAAVGSNSTQTVTAESTYTLRSEVPAAPSTRMATEELIVAATGTYTGTFTLSNTGTSWIGVIATFKAGSSGSVFNDAWDVKTPVRIDRPKVIASGLTPSDLINR